MSQLQWPITINGQEFAQPFITDNKVTVNGEDILKSFESCPALFCYLQQNSDKLDNEIAHFISNTYESFEAELLEGSLGWIKCPETEWQEPEAHRYVIMKGIQCEDYNGCILPFHDDMNQYKMAFVDISETTRKQSMTEFESEECEQDFIITCKSNIEIIYKASANDDEIVRELGMKNMCLKFCKYLLNDRLDEIEGSSEDSFKVYFIRLRGKHRNGHFGEIFNVQGIISRSQWDIMESKLKEITDEDEDYDCPQSVISYRLTREELFGKLQIDATFLMRIFDQFGKEMKVKRSISDIPLYNSEAAGFNQSRNNLLFKIQNKYKKKNKVITSLYCSNGVRINYNKNTRLVKISTNSFESNVSSVDVLKNKVRIAQVLGRKRKW